VTTYHDLLIGAAEAHGQRPALLIDDAELSYDELLARVVRAAAGLTASGIGPSDHVAIVMDNSLECVLAWLASSLIGCTEIPINPQYRGELLHYLLDDSGTTAVICDRPYLPQVIDVMDRLPAIRSVFVNGDGAAPSGTTARIVDFASCMKSCIAPGTFTSPDDAPEFVILYTSGTTGPSKGVIHTQRSSLVLSRYNAEVMEYGPEDRLLNFFPLFHQNARYTGVIPALVSGASIRVERKLSTSRFWETCDKYGITAFNYLGSVLRMILNVTPPERHASGHTLRKAFGAGAPPIVWEEFEQKLGIRLTETYGLSEAPMATLNASGARRAPVGSAGKGSDLFEVAVVDDEDRLLGPDEIGEIVMRPRQPDAMMIGYHNKDAATVKAFRNLWFHSGDRGRLSAEGHLYFEERQKDSIRRRGENISAWEVESVLEMHPDIAEAAVYGMAAEDSDEDVAAALVLNGRDADLESIMAFAHDKLPAYAVPTLVRIVRDLPRTPTEKVKKEELRSVARSEHVDTSTVGTGQPSQPANG